MAYGQYAGALDPSNVRSFWVFTLPTKTSVTMTAQVNLMEHQ
ncbi:hypothetical protein C5167_031157 [Papaver somniferum]|nr:hypothetical protein C5167_031157 [Papaver somniferum]